MSEARMLTRDPLNARLRGCAAARLRGCAAALALHVQLQLEGVNCGLALHPLPAHAEAELPVEPIPGLGGRLTGRSGQRQLEVGPRDPSGRRRALPDPVRRLRVGCLGLGCLGVGNGTNQERRRILRRQVPRGLGNHGGVNHHGSLVRSCEAHLGGEASLGIPVCGRLRRRLRRGRVGTSDAQHGPQAEQNKRGAGIRTPHFRLIGRDGPRAERAG